MRWTEALPVSPSRWTFLTRPHGARSWHPACIDIPNTMLTPGRRQTADWLYGMASMTGAWQYVGLGASDAAIDTTQRGLQAPIYTDGPPAYGVPLRTLVTGARPNSGSVVTLTAFFDALDQLKSGVLYQRNASPVQLREAALYADPLTAGAAALYRVVLPVPLALNGSNDLAVVVTIDV